MGRTSAFHSTSHLFSKVQEKHSSSAAPLHINISPEDDLGADFYEDKEEADSILRKELQAEPEGIATFVENLRTGGFSKIIDNKLVLDDRKPVYRQLTEEEKEAENYVQLERWSYRLSRFFFLLQGLLGGVALLHLYLLFHESGVSEFIGFYKKLARVVGTLFLILTFMSLIGISHLAVNEYRHYRKVSSTKLDLDSDKDSFPYFISLFCLTFYGIAYVITLYTTSFMNELNFKKKDNISESRLEIWKILCGIREVLLILAWILINVTRYWNIGSIYRMKLEELTTRETVTVLTYLQDIYKHLFYGNPYVPTGVYEVYPKKTE